MLVITGSALFIATGMLFTAQAEIAGSSAARSGAQARALAWSGLQAVMARLDEQREAILRGELPALDEQYQIYEADGRTGVVRLLPVTPSGERLATEGGKLDLNSIDAERLIATGMVDEGLAEAIIAYRSALRRPFQSVEELLRVPGVTPELLHGPIEELTPLDDASFEEGDLAERVSRRLAREAGGGARGLADVLTVFAFEPALQRSGVLRINLNVPWSDALARRIDDRFGEGASVFVKRIIDEGTSFDSDRKIVEVLRFFQSPPEDWPDILDAITADSEHLHFGRLDINAAPYEALLGLPGMTPEQAAAIVRGREAGLSDEDRSTIVWPLLHGILEAEQYDELADKMTVRSWMYRVRLAAGEVEQADDSPRDAGPSRDLTRPVIWEAVIDLSAPRPRIAYLRDVTLLQPAAMIAANVSLGDAGSPFSYLDDDTDEWEEDRAEDEQEEWNEDDRPDDEADDDGAGPPDQPDGAAPSEPAGESDAADPMESEVLNGDAERARPAVPGRERLGRWRQPR